MNRKEYVGLARLFQSNLSLEDYKAEYAKIQEKKDVTYWTALYKTKRNAGDR